VPIDFRNSIALQDGWYLPDRSLFGQLREILHDHLVTRRAAPVDYDAVTPEAQLALAEYAERCKGNNLGIGRIDPLTGLWRPLFPMRDRYG
jgi:hypothetical protein